MLTEIPLIQHFLSSRGYLYSSYTH